MKVKPVVIIIPILIAFLGLIIGSSLVWQLFIFSVIILVLGYLWLIINVRGIEVKVKDLPGHSRVGDWFEEEFIVSNNSVIPKSGLIVSGVSDLPGYGNSVFLDLSPEDSHSWKSRIDCLRRGLYSLGTVNITVSDPLGLITLNRISGETKNILVFPETLLLPFFEPETYVGTDYGTGQLLRSETSSTIGQVREYTSGDTLNHIHWPSTAHVGTLMVKVFENDQMRYQSRNVWLVLNMLREDHTANREESTEDYAVTIASSLLNKYLDAGKETGLLMAGDRRYCFTPGFDDEFRYRVDEALARIRAAGKESVGHLISEEMSRFDRDSVVIIITPFIEADLITNVHALRNRGCLVVAILLDSTSFGGRPGSLKQARDLAAGGAQVYIVRKDDNIARILDSRHISSPLMYGE
ncbi:MAG: hypothetical protein A2158_04670 [Chloroflexi bacterium RBG_13_46_14]|nr:MAG: hypothetical protein A2158_04670 [Chloroflexi bacterium RBG_13_46_14]